MNYAWRGEGGYGASAIASVNVGQSHSDDIVIPDAQLLFTAEFRRAGPDLVLTGHDGRHLVIPDYFLIDLLVGSPTPGQYAQAQPGISSAPIGKIEKVVGNVTVVRNGVAIAANVGDNVERRHSNRRRFTTRRRLSRWHRAQSPRQHPHGAQRFLV